MKMLRAMREPLKYVQGKNACLEFEKEMGYMGKRFLFVCSNSGYKATHAAGRRPCCGGLGSKGRDT